jgi:transcription termination factor Rho
VDQQAADRSLLETKERDELSAIADALGVRVGTRMKKADMVEAIVSAASNGSSGALAAALAEVPTKPKRARSTRKKADDADAAAADGGEASPADEPAAATNGAAASDTLFDAPAGRNGDHAAPPVEAPSKYRFAQLPDVPAVVETDPAPANGSTTADAPAAPAAAEVVEAPEVVEEPALEEPEEASATTVVPETELDGAEPAPISTYHSEDDDGDADGDGEGADGEGAEGGGRNWDDGGDRSGRRRRRRGRDRERGDEFRPAGERGGQHTEHVARDREVDAADVIEVAGLLEIRDEGYGFLRTSGVLPSKRDVYVSASQVRRFGLRKGDYVNGATRPPSSNEKYPALLRVDQINGVSPEDSRQRPEFESLTPLFPDTKLRLELPGEPDNMTGRIVDLISPIGKGQRGLIVSPPKAGKTTIMKQIVHAIERNNPEVHLIVVLVDERPEEVTDMRRHVIRGEVVASTFDRPADEHIQVAELTIERAKRLVETGKDVVIVLDGITRLARAYNLGAPATGRIMSGGVDSGALYPPKRFFGAARNIEEGGSLTILATALVETGSKMDEVIFEEFKGTGNMELRLDRRMAERRVYPAIDVDASSTRHEELLFERRQLQQVWKLRRVLGGLAEGGSGAGLEMLIDRLKTFRTNDEFLAEIAKAPTSGV